jgi:serine/threonine protein kinase
VKVDEKKVLGSGTYGNVYPGTFEGNPVAVKEFKRSVYAIKKEQEREMEEHFRLDHENVLKLVHVDESRDTT